MTATWTDIQSWDHNAIIETEDLIEERVREAHEITADLRHAANDIQSQGEGPDRMRQRLTEIRDELDSHLNKLTEYALATMGLHGYVSRMVAIRESAYEVAAELHETIPKSSYVITPPMEVSNNPDRYEEYRGLHTCTKSTVDLATEAETTVSPRFKALADGQYTLAEGRRSGSAGLASGADPSRTSEGVSVQWKLLSDSEREALINGGPEKYGNLDGIDMTSRARASESTLNGYFDIAGNRIPGLFEKTQKGYGEAKATYEKGKDSFWGSQYSGDEGYEHLLNTHNELNDLRAIEKALDAKSDNSLGDNSGISLISLGYGESGKNVLAALVIEDVDSTEYVAAPVPGMTTNCCNNTVLNLSYASNLRDAAVRIGADRGNVTTITWFGYNAPPALPDPSVTSAVRAEAGTVSLRSFMTGIHSWHIERGLDVYQAGITRSYGSTTGGIAIRSIGEDVVDSFACTGSPGTGVASVGTLGVDRDHVWVSAVPHHDAIQGIRTDGNFGLDLKSLKDIEHLSGDASRAKDYSTFGLNLAVNRSSYFAAPEAGKENHTLNDLDKVIADAKER